MPTIVDLLGAEDPGEMHGTSLRDVLEGNQDQIRPIAITTPSLAHDPNGGIPSTITDGEWTLFYSGDPEAPHISHETRTVDSMAHDVRVLEDLVNEPALYHMPSDPQQQDDVIDQHRSEAERLHGAHVEFLEKLGMGEEYLRYRRRL